MLEKSAMGVIPPRAGDAPAAFESDEELDEAVGADAAVFAPFAFSAEVIAA